jgi:hypothetical protein
VAHFKLSLQLAGRDLPDTLRDQWAYYPGEGERLGVYLTNALEEPHEMTGLPLFTQWVADETNAANEVKQFLPIMVVMGNPPYSNFGMMNKGEWILDQLKDYKKGLNERKINLDDDFIKFIRFGQWRIDRSGAGILAYIAALVAFCRFHGIRAIDCQQNTRHLASLGAAEMPRVGFVRHCQDAAAQPAPPWVFEPLYWQQLMPDRDANQ